MIKIRVLTPELRNELKAPLGPLLKGSITETTKRLRELVKNEKPAMLIAVGDVVTGSLTDKGIVVDVAIMDNKIMRKPIAPIDFEARSTFRVSNPAGTISDESWEIVRKAIESKRPVKVVVDGEEDLLTLVAASVAPEGSIVVYGQPNEGMVTIKVTDDAKKRVLELIERMTSEPSQPQKG